MAKALVMGASGFLGSHVVKALAARDREVRVMARASSDLSAIEHLRLERVNADIQDPRSLEQAMDGCDTVFYCIVDTRAWLRDPAPLYTTNVDGLRNAMEAALAVGVKRFIFTSTFGTIGINPAGISTEADRFNWWDKAPDYIRCRVQAEDLFVQYCRDKGLPGVACCIGNTYGADDVVPTPHGQMIKDVAFGKMPIYWDGGGPSVGITDAAEAMLLAQEHGEIGERYIVAQRWVDYRELFALAAARAGVSPPRTWVPLGLLYIISAIADGVSFFTRRDNRLSVASLRCSTLLPNVNPARAMAELHWQPRPIEASVAEAVDYYLANP